MGQFKAICALVKLGQLAGMATFQQNIRNFERTKRRHCWKLSSSESIWIKASETTNLPTIEPALNQCDQFKSHKNKKRSFRACAVWPRTSGGSSRSTVVTWTLSKHWVQGCMCKGKRASVRRRNIRRAIKIEILEANFGHTANRVLKWTNFGIFKFLIIEFSPDMFIREKLEFDRKVFNFFEKFVFSVNKKVNFMNWGTFIEV